MESILGMRNPPLRKRHAWLPIWIIATLLLSFPVSGAENSDGELVQTKRKALDLLRNQKQEQLDSLKDSEITPELLNLAKLDLDSATVQQQSILVESQDAAQTLNRLDLEAQSLEEKLREQDTSKQTDQDASLPDRPTLQKQLEENRKQHQEITQKVIALKNLLKISYSRIEVLSTWHQQLLNRHQNFQSRASEDSWALQLKKLEASKLKLLDKAANLEQILAKTDQDNAPEKHHQLQTDIFLAEQNAGLIDLELQLHNIENELISLNESTSNPVESTDQLTTIQQRSKTLLSQLGALDGLFGRRIHLVTVFSSLAKTHSGEKQKKNIAHLSTLREALVQWQIQIWQQIEISKEVISEVQSNLEDYQRLELSTRNPLPDSIADWHQVLEDLKVTLPQGLAQIGAKLQTIPSQSWKPVATLTVLALWIALFKFLANTFKKYFRPINKDESAFSTWFINILGQLLQKILLTVTVIGSLLIIAGVNRIPFEIYSAYLYLGLVFLLLQTTRKFNRLLYEQRHSGIEWYDRSLFLGLKWSSIFAAGLISLTLLVHHYPVAQITKDTIDRLLMLGLITVSVLLFWRRRHFLDFFKANLQQQPRLYFFLAILSLLLPLAGLLTALIGIAGYTNLAWKMGKYEGLFLLAFFFWLIMRGYLIDSFEWAERRAMTYQPNGWIWAKAIISPLQVIARMSLLVLAFLFLFWLIQINGNTSLISELQDLGKYPLFKIGDTDITSFKILIAGLVIIVFVWAARWSKEIAYRWLFNHINDHGARNSLSVFTQYSVVLIGIFALLKALGIDLTALAVLAGAIGVGIGFGLQTIANNFISGILLLIERPFRTGDIVNIGNNEGMVTHIGIRSLTVKTWDNMEVIIPNTDTVTSPFTNWTYHDTHVRTTLYVGVAYKEDLHSIIQFIHEILEDHESILSYPRADVFLDEFADSSINFRIHYYIDVAKNNRLNIKSEVLLAIWDRFKQEGIEIPYPQSDLHIKDARSPKRLSD